MNLHLMYVYVTDMSVYVPTLNTIFTAPSLQIIVGSQVYASLLYSKTCSVKFPPGSQLPTQHGIYKDIQVYDMYIHGLYLYVHCSQAQIISHQAQSALLRWRVSALRTISSC